MSDKVSVLGVDDRPANLVALEAVLEPLDITFVKAYSGREAILRIESEDFALILMDAQMPEMDGFETAEHIRADKKNENIPIIFVTAISKEPQHVFRGYGAGAVDYLFKPLNTDILRSKVKVFIDLFRQREDIKRANLELESANRKIVDQQSMIIQKERRETIFQMAGALASDLNSPLMALLGNIDLVRMDDDLSPRHAVYINRIEDSAKKIADTVKKIREIQQVASNSGNGNGTIDDFLKKICMEFLL